MAAAQIKPEQIERWFTFQLPPDDAFARRQAIRDAARGLVETIVAETQQGPDQHAAVRKVREAVMTAFEAITVAK